MRMIVARSEVTQTTVSAARAGVPPWLWFWVAAFLASAPAYLDLWRRGFEDLGLLRESTRRLQAVDPSFGRLNFLLYPSVLVEVIPTVALLLGLLVTLIPWLRAVYVERRFGLGPPAGLPAEVQAFLRLHAPNLQVKVNLLRPRQLAFVYPSGYRKATLALFGGFIKLWRSDRQAAEAVLLHEIAHYRRGDALILGTGSFFESVIKYALLYYLLFLVLPFAVLVADQLVSSRRELVDFGLASSTVWAHQLEQIATIDLPGILFTTLGYLFRIAGFFVLPLAGIWSAELNADWFVISQQQSIEGVSHGLGSFSTRVPWWRWLLFHLSHPPTRLRTWLLAHPGPTRLSGLLFLFPLGYGIRLLILHGYAITSYMSLASPWETIWQASIDNSVNYVVTLLPIWLAMTAVLLFWPLLARPWEFLFARESSATYRSDYGVYALAAAGVGVVYLLASLLV
ncbi:MAG TPA: hypothetical protein DEP84_28805 [Chloroflexi bacterium]|nr:hypothetical protein [Chloroflexota bacterium]